MQRDVMTVELLEDFPSFASAIERFMSCTHKALHLPVFFGVRCTLGALDVVKSGSGAAAAAHSATVAAQWQQCG